MLIGGAGSVGISAMTLAYSMGFRDMHLFGFDSSIRAEGGLMHAYEQPMNEGEQLILDRLGSQAYWMSYTMAVQYQYFPQMEAALESMGCKITVYGSGILPDRWKLKQNLKSEKEKYEYVWSHKEYGNMSPAELLVDQIAEFVPSEQAVVDLGCGVGRAGVKLSDMGYDVTLMDFASNSRCDEALSLIFIEHDLSEPLPATWGWGYCCDVMEHIPPEQVDTVLKNVRNGVDNVFFRIEHHMDGYGPALIGSPLHLSVHDETWWKAKLHEYWPSVECRGDGIFLATTDEW